jgi:hypothetical protein
MTFLKLFLRFTWELPQTVVGLFVFISGASATGGSGGTATYSATY